MMTARGFGLNDPAGRKFELDTDENNNLIFKQFINITPTLNSLDGFTINDQDQFSLTKNEFVLTMKISLNQELDLDKTPEFEIVGIEQIIGE